MAGKQRLFLPTILTLICAVSYGYAEYKLVCYYTNWSQYRTGIGKFMPKDIDPNLCTHIVYAFGKLVGNQITNFEWNDNDEWSNLYKQVNDLKIKNPKLKTLLAMGGWTAGSLVYSNMVSTKANRKEFIDASIAWCRKYNFDGLDMDWEYPANRDGKPQDYDNFAHFCKETREAFEEEAALTGRKRLLFTSAVAAGKSTIDTAYNVPVMAQYMDFICIMAYDLHGSWEKFTGLHSGYYASDNDSDKTLNVAFAADYWNKKGAPKEKLIIGLGTYGRSFTLASTANYGVGAPASGAGAAGKYTRENGFLAYYEICEMQASGKGTTYRDPKAQVPYYVDPSTKLWVGFDDETSLRVKLTDLIINQGYGGAMTWALPLDDFTGTFCGGKKYPLISLMKETLENNGGAPQTTQKPVTAGPTTVKPPTAAPTSANPLTTSKPSSQAPVQTTTTGGGSGFCANKPNGQYVDPTDCSSFYDCWDHAGTARKCPDGMLFDSVHQWCDCESVVTCDSAVPPTPVPSTPAPSTEMPSTAGPSTAGPISSTDSSNQGNSEYKLVCYYTNWSQYRTGIGKFMPKDIDPNLCTHIVYAFGKLVGNKITNFEWNDNDEWSNLYKQVNDLKVKNPKLKTLLAMGGWTAGSLAYSNMASTKENRKEFIDASIAWCRKYNFDGLDMDWEYPANRDGKPQDYDNFAHLCKETREAFEKEAALTGRKRLLFTSAVAAGKYTIDTAYNVPVMAKYMDFICIMAYDLHGSWEKFTGLHSGYHASDNDKDKRLNVAFAADYWNKKGAPKEKLIIGLGTYGRSFTLASASDHGVGAPASGAGAAGKYTREKGFLAYYEICEMQASGKGTTYRDPKAQVPYYVDPATKLWVGFDDETSLRVKLTDLIIKQGYGGAMTWALPLDDFTGTFCGGKKYPLISLMKETLEAAGNGGTPQTTTKPVTPGPSGAPTSAKPQTVQPPTAKPSTRAPIQTTTTGGNSGFCANKPNGRYVDPLDCSSYYDCWNKAGTVRKCPDGMLFDSVHQRCDCESVVICDSAVPPSPVPSTSASSTEMPSTARTSTTEPISSTDSSNLRICVRNGAVRDPHDCAQYYECWGGEIIGNVKRCGEGLLFSNVFKGCDYADRVSCDVIGPSSAAPTTRLPVEKTTTPRILETTTTKQRTTPKSGNICENKHGGVYPHSTDCNKYIQCNHQTPIVRNCGAGLHFNNAIKGCDWPWNAGCQ